MNLMNDALFRANWIVSLFYYWERMPLLPELSGEFGAKTRWFVTVSAVHEVISPLFVVDSSHLLGWPITPSTYGSPLPSTAASSSLRIPSKIFLLEFVISFNSSALTMLPSTFVSHSTPKKNRIHIVLNNLRQNSPTPIRPASRTSLLDGIATSSSIAFIPRTSLVQTITSLRPMVSTHPLRNNTQPNLHTYISTFLFHPSPLCS